MKLPCPSCGAEVPFKSRGSVYAICQFCQSILVRHDLSLENLGKMSPMPQDMSPLQLGTTGTYEGRGFEILGRRKVRWEHGAWNEWYLHFTAGKEGWLADAQGFYAISFTFPGAIPAPNRSEIKVSDVVVIGDTEFKVNDIRDIVCLGGQGELPVQCEAGIKSTSVDLISDGEKFASLEYSDNGVQAYIGRYLDFEKFNFKNLREVDGW